MSYASGTIPTPSGDLQIRWKKNSAGRLDLTIEAPPDLEPEVVELPESPLGIVKFVNGKIQCPATKVLFESLRPNSFLRAEYAT